MMQDGCGFFLTPPLHPQLQEEVSAEFSRMDATDIDVELPRLPFASHLASFGKHQQSTSDFFAHATAVEIRSQFAALEERTARKPRESRHVSELEETIARFDTQLVADQELAETPGRRVLEVVALHLTSAKGAREILIQWSDCDPSRCPT
eukprot:CAMPEP_0194490544 /NCGR_PEP_ID=MMETSP0253-20130528/9727_1 /TAXON_ID=2966 /ORGANISM="Noctiluca scintillans" /LENGTH=149 /DNA_ID=CAMNT_0039331185 /DNA_START=17 /DNA_END=467 /DNA_ORIENTATION=-